MRQLKISPSFRLHELLSLSESRKPSRRWYFNIDRFWCLFSLITKLSIIHFHLLQVMSGQLWLITISCCSTGIVYRFNRWFGLFWFIYLLPRHFILDRRDRFIICWIKLTWYNLISIKISDMTKIRISSRKQFFIKYCLLKFLIIWRCLLRFI